MQQHGNNEPPDTTSRRLGRGMAVIAWVLLLGMLTLFFQGKLEDRVNPNRDVYSTRAEDGRVEVVLERNRMGHYLFGLSRGPCRGRAFFI